MYKVEHGKTESKMLGGLIRNCGTGTSRLGGMSRMESEASSLGKFDAGSDSIAIKNY